MKIRIRSRKKSRIEMLPLIDIVFLLLVFFIYAMMSMAVHRGLPVRLPVSETAAVDKKLTLAVSVRADGRLYLDRTPVDLARLTSVLQAKTRGEADPGVLLFADQNITYQYLFDVLDRIRKAGLSRISLQAEREPTP
jgi:biopolymer transport protein ExbD